LRLFPIRANLDHRNRSGRRARWHK
jgi:hypothetical protein